MRLNQFDTTIAERISAYGKAHEGSYEAALEVAQGITRMLGQHISTTLSEYKLTPNFSIQDLLEMEDQKKYPTRCLACGNGGFTDAGECWGCGRVNPLMAKQSAKNAQVDTELAAITQKVVDKKIKEVEAKHSRLQKKLAGGMHRE